MLGDRCWVTGVGCWEFGDSNHKGLLTQGRWRLSISEYVSELDVRSRSVPPPFLVRSKSVPIYQRYKPHDRDESFGEVRTMVINGEPWFVGKDVAMMLGHMKPGNAVAMHVEIEASLKQGLLDSKGKTQQTIFINESGLYALILSSKLPQAKESKRWVTSEVLPQIRKTGGYIPINGCDLVKRSNGQTFFKDTPVLMNNE